MNHKTTILFLLLLTGMTLALHVNLFPHIALNRLNVAYSEPDTLLATTTHSIEGLIVEGAGFLITGSGNINQLLNTIELQDANGIDTIALNSAINTALVDIQNALMTYEQLVQKAMGTPYNTTVLNGLKSFPYDEFIISEGLNETIFDEVAIFLREGDITGILKSMYNHLISIEVLLNSLKTELLSNNCVNPATAMKLNETTSDLLLFGSYVARVFAKF